MTGPEYQSALTTLSLTPDQAAVWLGIGRSTAYRYLKTGCEGAVERALGLAVKVWAMDRYSVDSSGPYLASITGNYVRHSDLTAAVGLPG